MNKIKILTTCFLSCGLLITACNNGNSKEDKTDVIKKDSTVQTIKTNTGSDSSFALKAKFVNFQLGDAAHFLFTDESGNDWDFGDIDDTSAKFAIELPKEQANDQNQGYAVNKELQGKWFNIKYVNKMQPLYADGPVGKVSVIIEAKPAQ